MLYFIPEQGFEPFDPPTHPAYRVRQPQGIAQKKIQKKSRGKNIPVRNGEHKTTPVGSDVWLIEKMRAHQACRDQSN